MSTLGDRLHEVMRELGIDTPRAMADYCHVSEGLVSQWFSGLTNLGPKPLKALSKTHFNLEWITNGHLPKYRRDIETNGGNHLSIVTPTPEDAPPTAEEILELITDFMASQKKDRNSIRNLAKTSAKRSVRKRSQSADNNG